MADGAALIAFSSCATPAPAASAPVADGAAATPSDTFGPTSVGVNAAVLDAVVQQLECPKDQVLVRCIDHDRTGECIAVTAKGCEREIEYRFGTD